MPAIWTVSQTDYDIESTTGQGQVKVTGLNWTATLEDGDITVSAHGNTDETDTNRTYALPALQAVPESVVVGWAQDALGEDEVASIEATLVARIDEQVDAVANPTSGIITY
jgi:hypothetical protein